MNANTRHEIDSAILENDLDALADLLTEYEYDDDARCKIFDGIDKVAARLDGPIDFDGTYFLD